jgi:hypothetical protein
MQIYSGRQSIWIKDMDCNEFRKRFAEFDQAATLEIMQTDAHGAWADHFHECHACMDWGLGQRVLSWGNDPGEHPCVHMAYHALKTCPQHEDRAECPDLLITRDARDGTYRLIKPGSAMPITHCPWCGTRLPEPENA